MFEYSTLHLKSNVIRLYMNRKRTEREGLLAQRSVWPVKFDTWTSRLLTAKRKFELCGSHRSPWVHPKETKFIC